MRSLLLLLFLFLYHFTFAQSESFWSTKNESLIQLNEDQERGYVPQEYQTYSLELENLISYLADAPMERTEAGRHQPLNVELPLPDGGLHEFMIVESPVMMPGLAARYEHIKSFSGYSTDDSKVNVRLMYSDLGFHAVFYSPTTRYYIQPYATNLENTYIVYDRQSLEIPMANVGNCGSHGVLLDHGESSVHQVRELAASNRSAMEMVNIREYRMAVAGVAEWTANHGGTVSGGLSAVNVIANTLNSFYLPEVATRFVLVENNDELIYTDADTDPYVNVTNTGPFNANNPPLIDQNQTNLDIVIGAENYDIGHVMTMGCSGIGGQAIGNSICQNDDKAKGVTCQYTNNLEFIISEVATHEIGHQFSASHTWNNCEGEIGSPPVDIINARAGGTAYEPGSGSTIMSYVGGCQSQNVQFNTDYYFHVASLDQMYGSIGEGNGSQCVNLIPTNNHFPELNLDYPNGFYIPISTPFELKANATDLDEDNLTYCWEQYNLGPVSDLGDPILNGPSFRSWLPTENPTRVFPRIQTIINNSSSDVEVLPTYARNLKFRCTVRDNNPEVGGVVWEEMSFEATDQAGPFLVQYPSDPSLAFEKGEFIEVTWDVANTDATPVNAATVNIKLSIDGGMTYPFTLSSGTPNDGSEFVALPDVLTSSARIKVEAAQNIFFDISNFNFQITEASEPGFAFSASPTNQQVCIPDDVVIDLQTFGLLGYDSLITFSVTGLPEGAISNFANNPTLASVGTVLTIETANINSEGLVVLDIIATAPDTDTLVSMDTLIRTVNFDLVNNDFSALVITSPANGSSGVAELPTFTWDPTPNATNYEIEIATNPSFAPETIVEIAQLPNISSFTPSVQLDGSTLHFWRIRPQNECGYGEYTAPQGFYTEIFTCNTFVSPDVPVNITGVGTPTVESILEIESDIIINDLNVAKIKGSHDLVKHLDVYLISPDGTEVLLFAGECGVSTSFDMKLDDEAPEGPITCFNGNFQPEGMLSDFDGLSSVGDWILRATVNNADGTGGSLQEWSLELCSNASTNPPFLVNNETLPVAPGEGRVISDEFLLSQDDDNGPSALTYTVVTAPEFGTLYFQNEPVEVGMTFRQSSLNAGNVKYVNDDASATTDGFTFAVEDGEGGWFGTPLFEIMMDENAPVNTEELLNTNSFTIFPNPAQDQLNIQFKQAINGRMDVRLTNVQGQVLQNQRFDNVFEQIQLNTNNLTSGIYFIFVDTDFGTATKKVVIQR